MELDKIGVVIVLAVLTFALVVGLLLAFTPRASAAGPEAPQVEEESWADVGLAGLIVFVIFLAIMFGLLGNDMFSFLGGGEGGQALTGFGFILLIVVLLIAAVVVLSPAARGIMQNIFPEIINALGG